MDRTAIAGKRALFRAEQDDPARKERYEDGNHPSDIHEGNAVMGPMER